MKTKEILKLIKKADVITIFRHVGPDGDAYGSQLGLKRLLEINYPNKKIYCLGEKSTRWEHLVGVTDEVDDETIKNSLAIVLDTPNTDRISDARATTAREIIKIDHHIFVAEFATVEWVDTNFSSVCEMITSLSIDCDWKIDKQAATPLYAGLITDAGRFLYSYTPNLFACAAYLVGNGAEVAKIYPFIYEQSIVSTRFHGYCQCNFQQTPYGVGYNKLTPDILERFNIPANQGAGIVNALSNIDDIDIWAHFSETEEGTIRAELRSKGLPVNLIANEFGGGGHRQAAGATLLNWDEVDIVLTKLDRLSFESKPYHEQLEVALEVAKEAGKIVLGIYEHDKLNVEIKNDNSPVTQADKTCDAFVRQKLREAYPEYGLLSEEYADDLSRLEKEYVWIVDPVDGTKDFIAHDDEFAINIALIHNHKVVLGIIAVPAKNICYYATQNGGAYKNENGQISKIKVAKNTTDLVVLKSHFHQLKEEEKIYNQFAALIKEEREVGSAYKAGLIAEGKANLNIKLGPNTKEWDIAPGVIIVQEAGGYFVEPDGKEFSFNRIEVRNLNGYVIMNKMNRDFLPKKGE